MTVLSAERFADADRVARSLRDRWNRTPALKVDAARLATIIIVVLYIVLFSQRVWFRHEYFGTFDYDLGMYDQGIWQLSRGRGFMTVRGMHVFGHHANLGYLLLAPFYWLGAGPHFLNLLNTVAVVAVSIPLYLMCRTHMRSEWAGFWITFAYLGHFVPQWMIKETFHAENLAAPFLVGAFYCASVKRWRWYWFCLFGAMIWKEDIALAVAMMGISVAIAFREPRRGLITSVVGAVWFLLATRLLMASLSPDAVFDTLFGPLGDNATEVVRNSITQPDLLGEALGNSEAAPRSVDMLRPYGFVSLLSPDVLIIGLPQYIVNFSTTMSFTWDLRHHYNMVPFIAVVLAATHSVVRRSRAIVAWSLIAVMVAGVVADRQSGVGPWSENYRVGHWPLEDTYENSLLRDAISSIDDDADVSTMYYLVPHLSHREHIYTFPNPWRASNYGVKGEPAPPDPESIDQVLVDIDRLNDVDLELYEELEASGEWCRKWRVGSIVLLDQQSPGGSADLTC